MNRLACEIKCRLNFILQLFLSALKTCYTVYRTLILFNSGATTLLVTALLERVDEIFTRPSFRNYNFSNVGRRTLPLYNAFVLHKILFKYMFCSVSKFLLAHAIANNIIDRLSICMENTHMIYATSCKSS